MTAAQVAVVWGAVAARNIVDIHLALRGLVRAKVKGQFHENFCHLVLLSVPPKSCWFHSQSHWFHISYGWIMNIPGPQFWGWIYLANQFLRMNLPGSWVPEDEYIPGSTVSEDVYMYMVPQFLRWMYMVHMVGSKLSEWGWIYLVQQLPRMNMSAVPEDEYTWFHSFWGWMYCTWFTVP